MMFAKTKEALSDLQKILHCGQCSEHTKELLCLGNCQHWFCRSCADSYAGYPCPLCGTPTVAKTLHIDHQLSDVVSLCSDMMELIKKCQKTSPVKETSNSCNGLKRDSVSVWDNETYSIEKCMKKRRKTVNDDMQANDKSLSQEEINFPTIEETGSKNETQSVRVSDSGFVRRRSARRKSNGALLSAVAVVNDSALELTTPEPRKSRSKKTPVSDGWKAKGSADDLAVTMPDHGITASQSNTKTKSQSSGTPLSAVAVVSDSTLELTTPEPSKIRSKKTPASNGWKDKGSADNLAVTMPDHGITASQSNTKSKSQFSGTPLSAVAVVSDSTLEFTTPQPRKSRSKKTPASSGRKVKDSADNGAVTNKRRQPRKTAFNIKRDSLSVKKTLHSTQKQAKQDKRNIRGETPLQVATIRHEAVSRGKADIAALLIARGAAVNAPGLDNLTPLHEAVVYQYADCVQVLIDNGANLFIRNANGYSPMDLAQKDLIKNLLLEASQSRSVQDVDVPLVDESTKPLCFVGSSLSNIQSKMLMQYAKTVLVKVVQKVAPTVTHLITSISEDGSCPRTLNYLGALVTGKWIVNTKWLEMSCSSTDKVPEQDFLVPGSTSHPESRAPHKAVENRLKQADSEMDSVDNQNDAKSGKCRSTKQSSSSSKGKCKATKTISASDDLAVIKDQLNVLMGLVPIVTELKDAYDNANLEFDKDNASVIINETDGNGGASVPTYNNNNDASAITNPSNSNEETSTSVADTNLTSDEASTSAASTRSLDYFLNVSGSSEKPKKEIEENIAVGVDKVLCEGLDKDMADSLLKKYDFHY